METYKSKLIFLFLLLLSYNTYLMAQLPTYWKFDKEGMHTYSDFKAPYPSLAHTKGLNGQAAMLKSHKQQYLKLPFEPRGNQAFSVSFWFLLNDAAEYTLLSQTQTDTEEDNIKQYIEISIKNNDIYGAKKSVLRKDPLLINKETCCNYTAQKWHYLTYTFDGTNAYQLFIDAELVNKNNMATLSSKRKNWTNALIIGKGTTPHHYFNGAIDELYIDTVVLSTQQIRERYESGITCLPKPTKQAIVLDTIMTHSNFLELEFWYEHDGRNFIKPKYINISINKKDSVKQVVFKKNKSTKENLIVALKTNNENTITLSADDLKEIDKEIVYLHIYELDTNKNMVSPNAIKEVPYSFSYRKDTNMLFQIIHQTKLTKKYVDAGTTPTTKIKLELLSDASKGVWNNIRIDDSKGATFRVVKKDIVKKGVTYTLELKENANNNIPLKIGFLDSTPSERFEIKFLNQENNDAIYAQSFSFKNNHHIYLNIQQKKLEKKEDISKNIKTIHLGKWINAKEKILKISDSGKQKKSLLHVELDGKLIAKNISLETIQNISLNEIANDSHLYITPVNINPLSKINIQIICKNGKKDFEDWNIKFDEEQPTHIQFQQ